jgi:diguanylate cyclase (GGDEF)-like protein
VRELAVTAMLDSAGAVSLDIGTLLVVATSVTLLLGVFLLFVWAQDRIQAVTWWGTAYLVGGFSVAVWSAGDAISPPLPAGMANALLFLACGLTWSAARLLHGRRVLGAAMAAGACAWLLAGMDPQFEQWAAGRIILGAAIVSVYAFLTVTELRRERRRHLLRTWPAMFVPILHGAVLLFPVPPASVLLDDGTVNLASGWIAVVAIEILLGVVGAAFLVFVLAKEDTVRVRRDAASTDELTGLPNRHALLASLQQLVDRGAQRREPVSALMFDLDHFKSINDRFGQQVGDEALRLFATVARAHLRASDVVGRIGGEEFFALLPGPLVGALAVAERVRLAFAAAAVRVGGCNIGATVSVGAACGAPGADATSLLVGSDAALYRAKAGGRNRVEADEDDMPTIFTTAPSAWRDRPVEGTRRWTAADRSGGPALAA